MLSLPWNWEVDHREIGTVNVLSSQITARLAGFLQLCCHHWYVAGQSQYRGPRGPHPHQLMRALQASHWASLEAAGLSIFILL